MQRLITLAAVAGLALMTVAPIGAEAAPTTTIWLTLSSPGLNLPNHEFQMNNYSQSGSNFTATTALDGSSAPLLTVAGKFIDEVIVRLDGQTLDTATTYKTCQFSSDNVKASASTQTQHLTFNCKNVVERIIPTPTPTLAPVLHMVPAAKPIVLPTK